MIKVERYTPRQAATWDDFLELTATATFLHKRAYMDYHAHRFVDCSLLARDNDRLVAVLPACCDGTTVTSHAGLSYGGLHCDLRHTHADTVLHVFRAMTAFLAAEGFDTLVYKPVPHIYHRYVADDDLYAMYRLDATLTSSALSQAIALSEPLPFDRGNKSGVNHALKQGVTVERGGDFGIFWPVLEQVLMERHGLHPVHSVDEMRLLHSRFPDQIELWTARHEGNVVAGVVMYYTARVAHAQYIAASPRGRELKALPLLFSRLIAQARERGFSHFDFGVSTEDGGRFLNEGLMAQKSRMGGRGVLYNTYTVHF